MHFSFVVHNFVLKIIVKKINLDLCTSREIKSPFLMGLRLIIVIVLKKLKH